VIVHVGVGSNLGDRLPMLDAAAQRVSALPGVTRCRGSHCYDTAPVGHVATRRFLNAVLELQTDRAPLDLLGALQEVELALGRSRTEHWGDRTIDLDLLLWGDRLVDLPALVLPHPELHRRRFVLVPLCDLAPEAVHPRLGRTVSELLETLPGDPPEACRPLATDLGMSWAGWMR
jgi:2-amino-4-hydroxy-6-hydroxymethyldihydropteridine diphosphokinase